jgi:hypothetical protein
LSSAAKKFFALISFAFFIASFSEVYSQRIAIVTPDAADRLAAGYAKQLANALESKFRVIDLEIAASAYGSLKINEPFNQTAESARQIGTLIGCDHFILVKTNTSRRSSSARPDYFEASAFLWLVNTRSGELDKWIRAAKQASTVAEAETSLVKDISTVVAEIESAIRESKSSDLDASQFVEFNADAKDLRPAMPYKRIKPQYTDLAYLFDIKATVEADVSIDEKGLVRRIDILRWAGFGLDDSVIEAINKMNWRPGERDGKPLPMRVLLRYNFTKIEKE